MKFIYTYINQPQFMLIHEEDIIAILGKNNVNIVNII